MTGQQTVEPSSTSPRRRRALRVARWLLAATVLALGAGMIGTRVLVVRAQRQHPPLGDWTEVDGLRQHFVRRGAGEPVVFVHGAFGASQDFVKTVFPELSARYTCIAWDRPGHGYSERPEELADPGVQARLLLELVRELDLSQPPLLVGFSFGGAVTLAAALENPSALRGVVLLNGPSHPWPDPLDFQYELPAIPVLGPLAVETLLMPLGVLFADHSVERAFDPLPVSESFATSPVSLSLRPASYRANAEDIRSLKPFLRAQSRHYEELKLPLTMVVSEGDLVVSPTIHSPALHAAHPESTMIRIPEAGHQILYTHPQLVIDVIDDTMARE